MTSEQLAAISTSALIHLKVLSSDKKEAKNYNASSLSF